jgi:hydrogenase maturation protease
LGPAIAAGLESGCPAPVTIDTDYQLNIEDAAAIAEHDVVLFVDASVSGPEPYSLRRIRPASVISFTSHSVSPESVLAISEEHFGAAPEAWVLGVRGYEFEMAEGLTPKAHENCSNALEFVHSLIRTWEDQGMTTESSKTILCIDDDPDIRAALRVVLEAEGFSVGEASNGEEGLKSVDRIQPDAVIVDLMMETVDSGSNVAKKLKQQGFDKPIYMLSTAGDTVRYNLDNRDMGLAGIFQKPIDPKSLVTTLKTKLGDPKA